MNKILIADSSPLIVLLKSDLDFILPQLFEEIIIPDSVYEEILAGRKEDIAKQKLPLISWLKLKTVEVGNETVEKFNLGKGETAVLKLALEIADARVLLDDFAARKAAKILTIPFWGTGGLLILAKQKGCISTVSEAIEKVQKSGLWLSDEIIKLLKEKAGE